MIVLRVSVRAPDLDAFITRYSRHIAGDHIFIFSKNPQPVGTRVRFVLQLAGGEPLIHGRGTVTRMQPDTGDSHRPPGMELQFVPLDERSQTLVEFMRATRSGMAEEVSPIVRAVVPATPSLATLPPALAKLPPATRMEAIPPLPPPPAATPPPPPTPPPTPTKQSVRPPSMSLEVGWKVTAATTVSPPNGFDPTLATEVAAAPEPPAPDAATVAAAEPAVVAGPAPAFAESWRDPSTDDAPPNGDLPANPFSEVSDGAIEYFVEWSIEQSIGPRSLPQAHFSDVPMALPSKTGSHLAFDPPSRRRQLALYAATFAAGVLVGGVIIGVVKRRAPAPPAAVAQGPVATPAPPPPVAAPPPAPAKEPPPAGPASNAELIVLSRPPGATVTIDGQAVGETPLTTHVGAGPHEVVVNKERYAAATATADAPGKLQLDLRRPTATLHVTSSPSDAEVVVSGQPRGRTPLDMRLPGFESYDVRVALAGARPWRKTIYLRNPTNRVDAALVPNKSAAQRSGRR